MTKYTFSDLLFKHSIVVKDEVECEIYVRKGRFVRIKRKDEMI